MTPAATEKSVSGECPAPCEAFPDPQVVDAFGQEHNLTPRERQILVMIARGDRNAEIGKHLGVSNATVRLHIGNIHRKLRTRNKIDLLLLVWRWCCSRCVHHGGAGQPPCGNPD